MSFSKYKLTGIHHESDHDPDRSTTVEIVINPSACIIIDLSTRARLDYRNGILRWPDGISMTLNDEGREAIDLEIRKGRVMRDLIAQGADFLAKVRREDVEKAARKTAETAATAAE